MENNRLNNKVMLAGVLKDGLALNHEVYNEKFYKGSLVVTRDSGVEDIIPVIVPEVLMEKDMDYTGKFVSISGEYRSRNIHNEDRNTLDLFVFINEFEESDVKISINAVELQGFICKNPVYRKTPLGREIGDVLLAVNRPFGKSSYIPCILWGRNALKANCLSVGDEIRIAGRIQSREYQKKMADDTYETRVAYEVSANRIEIVEGEK